MSRNLFLPLGLTPSGYKFKRALEWLGGAIAATGAVGSSAINALSGAGSSHAARSWQYDRLHEQREWQLQDYEANQQRMKDLMDYERDYNTPAQQMARYREAGLNPFLAAHQGDISSGTGFSAPSIPQSSRGEVPTPNVFYPNIDLGAFSLVERMYQGSSIQNDRVRALADFAKSLPDLYKSVGEDATKQIAGAIFGQNIDLSTINRMVKGEADSVEYEGKLKQIEYKIADSYGMKNASNMVALQEQEFNEMAARIGKMSSDAKVNDATIKKLASDYVRNLADAFKLRKEGEKYVADANLVNQMRALAKLQTTRLSFENRSQGFYVGSDVDWYLRGKEYQGNQAEKLRIWSNRESNDLYTAIDHALSEWLSIGIGFGR